MEHKFLYCELNEFRNVGLIQRNIVNFTQEFAGNYSNHFKKEVERVTMWNRYPSSPRNYLYLECDTKTAIDKHVEEGYDIVVVETKNWIPSRTQVKYHEISKPTVFVFGNEKLGVDPSIIPEEAKVLTLDDYCMNVGYTARTLATLLTIKDYQ